MSSQRCSGSIVKGPITPIVYASSSPVSASSWRPLLLDLAYSGFAREAHERRVETVPVWKRNPAALRPECEFRPVTFSATQVGVEERSSGSPSRRTYASIAPVTDRRQ